MCLYLFGVQLININKYDDITSWGGHKKHNNNQQQPCSGNKYAKKKFRVFKF